MKRSPEAVAAVRAMRATGASYRQLAERYGISEGTARNWCAGAEPPLVGTAGPPPPPPDAPLPEALDRLALELDEVEPVYAALCRRAANELRQAPDEDEVPPLPADAKAVDYVRYQMAQNQAAYKRSLDQGLEAQAQRYARTVATLVPVLARAEKEEGTSDDVTISRAELTAARARFEERLAALAAQPLTCAACGSELRMRLALSEAGVE